jgi:hypothetical protein
MMKQLSTIYSQAIGEHSQPFFRTEGRVLATIRLGTGNLRQFRHSREMMGCGDPRDVAVERFSLDDRQRLRYLPRR